jgi:hypothetical protein
MLLKDQVQKIVANKKMDGVGTLEQNQPKSAVIGIVNKQNADYTDYYIVVISSTVAESVLQDIHIWHVVYNVEFWRQWAGDIGRKYTRQIMTQQTKLLVGCRCVGKGKGKKEKAERDEQLSHVSLVDVPVLD